MKFHEREITQGNFQDFMFKWCMVKKESIVEELVLKNCYIHWFFKKWFVNIWMTESGNLEYVSVLVPQTMYD